MIATNACVKCGTAQDDPKLLHAGIRYLALHGSAV